MKKMITGNRNQEWPHQSVATCVVCVHGVRTNPEEVKKLYGDVKKLCDPSRNNKSPNLRDTLVIDFAYGFVNPLEAAGTIGARATARDMEEELAEDFALMSRDYSGRSDARMDSTNLRHALDSLHPLSRRSWLGAERLKQTVERLKDALHEDTPITVLSHSNGTAVTLAAIQDGMSITNWILLGSCLSQEAVGRGINNTRLAAAGGRVSKVVLNCRSVDDDAARLRGGPSELLWRGAPVLGNEGLPGGAWREEVIPPKRRTGLGRDGYDPPSDSNQYEPTTRPVPRESVILTGGVPSNLHLWELTVKHVSHFAWGDPEPYVWEYPSWWNMTWLTDASTKCDIWPDKKYMEDVWDLLGARKETLPMRKGEASLEAIRRFASRGESELRQG